ncbi:M23 family metallopeptidase [Pilimelia columellifera]|uniref:M23ase beta-sheet core domain-containing protein n=1 Tax=Pilimelia columellifera subsp. columellifera TaxID=706583 RepID=A0ABP6B278_9ACTN
MSIGEVQARITQIESMVAAVRQTATGAAGANGEFAAQLKTAMSQTAGADKSASVTGVSNGQAMLGATLRPPSLTNRVAANDRWTLPVSGSVSSEFGPRWGTEHEGIDFAARSGTAVRAAKDGVVKKASWYGGYGKAVIIDHGDGVRTLYGHNSKLDVKPGDRVQAGQTIARVGSTGDSTGPHLHFEVQVDGKAVNPRPWLKKHGVQL